MTIKETAGRMLLYFYQLQRTVPLEMRHRQVVFVAKADGGVGVTSDKKWLAKDLLDIGGKGVNVLNALMFLRSKRLITSPERVVDSKRLYIGIQLTDKGIDIIEGIERGADGQEEFRTAFNIEAAGAASVDDLIRQQLSDFLK